MTRIGLVVMFLTGVVAGAVGDRLFNSVGKCVQVVDRLDKPVSARMK